MKQIPSSRNRFITRARSECMVCIKYTVWEIQERKTVCIAMNYYQCIKMTRKIINSFALFKFRAVFFHAYLGKKVRKGRKSVGTKTTHFFFEIYGSVHGGGLACVLIHKIPCTPTCSTSHMTRYRCWYGRVSSVLGALLFAQFYDQTH